MTFDVTRPGEGDIVWAVADRLRFLGGVEGSDLELVEVEIPAGSGTPPHSHASPELFYVLEGEVTLRHFPPGAPPAACVAGPGTTARIGPMEVHNYVNESRETARLLVLVEASMIAFFRDIGTPAPEPQPDFARLGAAMSRHGITVPEMAG